MGTLKETASYLNGLTEGLELDESKKETKVILKLIEMVNELAERVEDLEDYVDELDEKVDEIDQDLGEVEEYVYDDEDYDDFDYDEDDDVYEFSCDNCGDSVFIDGELLDSDEPVICPNCGEEIKLDFGCSGNCAGCEDCE